MKYLRRTLKYCLMINILKIILFSAFLLIYTSKQEFYIDHSYGMSEIKPFSWLNRYLHKKRN